MGKRHICPRCSKEFSNRHNLSRHKSKYCTGVDESYGGHTTSSSVNTRHIHQPEVLLPESTATCSSIPDITKPTPNPKIQSFINDIIKKDNSESELNDSEESDSNDESMDVKFMSEDPVQLKKAFRNLYTKFDDNIQNLLLMLEELERINYLSSEECKGMKDHLRNKIEE